MLNGRGFGLPGLQTCTLRSDLYLVELRNQYKEGEKRREHSLKGAVCVSVSLCVFVCARYVLSRKRNSRRNQKIQGKKAQRPLARKPLPVAKQTTHTVSVNTLKTLEQYGVRETTGGMATAIFYTHGGN